VVLENSCRADEHECPFGKTSVELVKLLCDVLHIGETPSEQGQHFHPMFFTTDKPFEEFYCICIVLLNKTWKEMRATTEDFKKVRYTLKSPIYFTFKYTNPHAFLMSRERQKNLPSLKKKTKLLPSFAQLAGKTQEYRLQRITDQPSKPIPREFNAKLFLLSLQRNLFQRRYKLIFAPQCEMNVCHR